MLCLASILLSQPYIAWLFHLFIPPINMEQTDYPETSAHKIQVPEVIQKKE